MTADRRWALILGVSSGFGAATARRLASEGWNIFGVHLDRRSTLPAVEALVSDIESHGQSAIFFNGNAADDTFRTNTLTAIQEVLSDNDERITMMMHSLAFGTLGYLVPNDGSKPISRKQIEMTMDVMANSLVYWTQDVVAGNLMGPGRIFAMTSEGSERAWPMYGPVAAAKAALECYVRQLGSELAPKNITVNAILAGVTYTPALDKIPGADNLIAKAVAKNPYARLTKPEDVAAAIADLAKPGTYWLNSNVIRIDGGESSSA